jgi:hypothetical protein
METFHIFLKDPQLVWMNSVTTVDKPEFANLNHFLNVHSLYFSVIEYVFMLADNLFEKTVQRFHKVQS